MAFFIDEDMEYEIMENHSIFFPHVFESIFVRVKISHNKYSVICNIYHPNTAPLGNLNHFNDILSELITKIKKDHSLKSDKLTLIGDKNVNLLQYLNHKKKLATMLIYS